MIQTQIPELKTLLSTPQDIVIVPHKNPDGDAIHCHQRHYGKWHWVFVIQGESQEKLSEVGQAIIGADHVQEGGLKGPLNKLGDYLGTVNYAQEANSSEEPALAYAR